MCTNSSTLGAERTVRRLELLARYQRWVTERPLSQDGVSSDHYVDQTSTMKCT